MFKEYHILFIGGQSEGIRKIIKEEKDYFSSELIVGEDIYFYSVVCFPQKLGTTNFDVPARGFYCTWEYFQDKNKLWERIMKVFHEYNVLIEGINFVDKEIGCGKN